MENTETKNNKYAELLADYYLNGFELADSDWLEVGDESNNTDDELDELDELD